MLLTAAFGGIITAVVVAVVAIAVVLSLHLCWLFLLLLHFGFFVLFFVSRFYPFHTHTNVTGDK